LVARQIQALVMDRIDVEQATWMSREVPVKELEPLSAKSSRSRT
jgi:hypothetical protein